MNLEEKAKRYAQSQFRDINSNFTRSDLAQSFTAGYTQAVTDLSAENEKLRDALMDIIKEAEVSVISDVRLANNSEYPNYIEIDDFEKLIAKAKQLITEP